MKLLSKKILPFFILLIAVLGCTKLARQPTGKLEEQEKVVETLNKQFNLRDKDRTVYQAAKGITFDCSFDFREEVNDDKITLFVRFCESTSEYIKERKLTDVLTPENLALIKNAGFEKVVLYARRERELIDSVMIQ